MSETLSKYLLAFFSCALQINQCLVQATLSNLLALFVLLKVKTGRENDLAFEHFLLIYF